MRRSRKTGERRTRRNSAASSESPAIAACETGRLSSSFPGLSPCSGVTLIEMLIVVAIIGLLAGISFPAVSAGVESVRLASAGNSVASFFNAALNRAERKQQAIEITIAWKQNQLSLRSAEPGFSRTLELPDGVSIAAVHPQPPQDDDAPRRFLLLPGGTAPRIGIELVNRRGALRMVRIDPITGVPQVQHLETE